MYPFHVRLSIHAHCNSGPKFGIRMLCAQECKIIRNLKDSDATPVFDDLLHIPTPWHNCVINVEGESHYFIGKSEVAMKAIATGTYQGTWVDGDLEKGQGGYFQIWKADSPKFGPTIVQPVSQDVSASVI